jgi:hypothetical protein
MEESGSQALLPDFLLVLVLMLIIEFKSGRELTHTHGNEIRKICV